MRLSMSFAAALLFIVTPAVADAQSMADCDTPRRPAIGVAVGRSSPYFEPSLGVGGSGTSGSVLTRGGVQFAGRADLPIAGAWRARVEGAATNWRLERQIYSADFRQVIATETVGHVRVRQITQFVLDRRKQQVMWPQIEYRLPFSILVYDPVRRLPVRQILVGRYPGRLAFSQRTGSIAYTASGCLAPTSGETNVADGERSAQPRALCIMKP